MKIFLCGMHVFSSSLSLSLSVATFVRAWSKSHIYYDDPFRFDDCIPDSIYWSKSLNLCLATTPPLYTAWWGAPVSFMSKCNINLAILTTVIDLLRIQHNNICRI
jgi:hypothetical protein